MSEEASVSYDWTVEAPDSTPPDTTAPETTTGSGPETPTNGN